MKALLAGAFAALALAGASVWAAPARPKLSPAQQGHCAAGETVLYSCRFGASHGSVCAAPGRIAYRFGALGKPRIAIASTPDWSNIHIGRITGGGGGFQSHLRFSAAGHDYLVFEAVNGNLTDSPGSRRSGIHIQRGKAELATLGCALQSGGTAHRLEDARDFAPTATHRAIEEDDPRFDMWL